MIQGKYRFLANVFRKVGLFCECFKEGKALGLVFVRKQSFVVVDSRKAGLFVECFQEKYSYSGNDSRKISFFGECFQESRVLL